MTSYKYLGVELTPKIFTELLVLHFDGKLFKRETAVKFITEYHSNHGGILNKKEYISTFKKACLNLNDSGMVNIGYGTWRLNYKIKEIEILKTPDDKEEIEYTVDKTIGQGEKTVYVYYYDTYKKYAENIGKKFWECKIGRTDKDPLQRVFGQAGTCYPELPHVALIIKCDDSLLLESTLHNIFKLHGKWLKTAPGTEWYLTSPEEVEFFYDVIMNTKGE